MLLYKNDVTVLGDCQTNSFVAVPQGSEAVFTADQNH